MEKLCGDDMDLQTVGLNPKREIFQVIGCLLQEPNLLRDKKYKLFKKDFPEIFHKSIFASINNLIIQEAKEIDEIAIDNYLSNYETYYDIFKENDGISYLSKAKEKANLANFEYNYTQLRKFTLLRSYQEKGIYIGDIYDDTIVNTKQQEIMQANFDEMTIDDIINHFKIQQLEIEDEFSTNDNTTVKKAGDGSYEVKEKFKKQPLMGLGLESKMLTTVGRGAIKKQLVLSSSDTGGGKSRTAIGELACLCATDIWDFDKKEFVPNPNGQNNAGLYIGTEMDLDEEVEPIFWAYISGVPTERILDGNYEEGEEERVDEAIEILQNSQIYLVDEPDFNIQSLERHIENHKIKYNVEYVIFDYIQLTDELIAEAVAKKKGMGIREDQVLISLSKKLKDFAKKYDIWLKTMTQVNGDVGDYKIRDYRIIRGGKGIADKSDLGLIAMPPVPQELELIDPIIKEAGFIKKPNMVLSIYKGRMSRFPKELKIWQYVDFGTMRVEDLFCTDKYYNPIYVEKTYVNVLEEGNITDNEDEEQTLSNNEIRF